MCEVYLYLVAYVGLSICCKNRFSLTALTNLSSLSDNPRTHSVNIISVVILPCDITKTKIFYNKLRYFKLFLYVFKQFV